MSTLSRPLRIATLLAALADIVSKNGNLLLNIPVRGDGSIDEKEDAALVITPASGPELAAKTVLFKITTK